MTAVRFDRATLPSAPWKNGGGHTREIARIPVASALDDFDWRVSIADVSTDGPFSNFDHVDRVIVLLCGAGVILRSYDGKIDYRLDEPLVPFAFSGDDAITAALIDGASSDFNVMTRRGVVRADVQIVRAAESCAESAAGVLFAVALLCSGQNATLTGTLAGQIVMEGFVNIRLRPWLRRLITRLVAIVPAVIVVSLYGERGTGALLVLSQVVLSLQLPFAVFPLVSFTSDRRKMGALVAPRWIQILAWIVAVIIAALNAYLLYQTFNG